MYGKGKELTQDEAIEELANMIAKDKNIKNIFDVQEVLKKSFGKVIEGMLEAELSTKART